MSAEFDELDELDESDELSTELLQDFNSLIGGCQQISDEIEKSSTTLRSLSQELREEVPDGFGEKLDEIHNILKGTSKSTSKGTSKGKTSKGKIGEMIKSVLK